MDTRTNGNGVPMTVDEHPQEWTPPNPQEAFAAGIRDLDAGLGEAIDSRVYNKDLEDRVFMFCEFPRFEHEEEKTTAGGLKISAQDVAFARVVIFNPDTGTWDAPISAKFGGVAVVAQVRGLTYLQLTTRPFTIRRDPSDNRTWLLRRADREQLSPKGKSRQTPQIDAHSEQFLNIQDFWNACAELGYTPQQVAESSGNFRLVSASPKTWDDVYTLLVKQAGVAKKREQVGKKPVVHAE